MREFMTNVMFYRQKTQVKDMFFGSYDELHIRTDDIYYKTLRKK